MKNNIVDFFSYKIKGDKRLSSCSKPMTFKKKLLKERHKKILGIRCQIDKILEDLSKL